MYIFFFAGTRLTWQVTSTHIPVHALISSICKSLICFHWCWLCNIRALLIRWLLHLDLLVISANGISVTTPDYNFRKHLNKIRVNSNGKCDSESASGVVTRYGLRDCRICVSLPPGAGKFLSQRIWGPAGPCRISTGGLFFWSWICLGGSNCLLTSL
jgi:hypothetical protein